MSHRAIIAVQNRTTLRYSAVYLHNASSDGKATAANLAQNYTTAAKRAALMKLGDLSQLGANVKAPKGHTFDTPALDTVVAYARDRGDELHTHDLGGLAELFKLADSMDAEHIHLFMHGRWTVERVC